MRIGITGTYSSGKTLTSMAVSHFLGLSRTQARTMREILPEVAPDDEFLAELQIASMSVAIACARGGASTESALSAGKQVVDVSNVLALAHEDRALAFGMVRPLGPVGGQAWSLASCFAASLQLGQTLLYKLDGIRRTESNTLWMKRTRITLPQNLSQATAQEQPIFVRLDKPRKYTKVDGAWRRADIFSMVCNINILCSVTHRLPQS